MTEEMEDNNSWNEMIFQHIRARKDWILALIWRGCLEHENDTGHNEGEGFESKKKMNPNQENPSSPSGVKKERRTLRNLKGNLSRSQYGVTQCTADHVAR